MAALGKLLGDFLYFWNEDMMFASQKYDNHDMFVHATLSLTFWQSPPGAISWINTIGPSARLAPPLMTSPRPVPLATHINWMTLSLQKETHRDSERGRMTLSMIKNQKATLLLTFNPSVTVSLTLLLLFLFISLSLWSSHTPLWNCWRCFSLFLVIAGVPMLQDYSLTVYITTFQKD